MKYFLVCIFILSMIGITNNASAETLTGGGFSLTINSNENEGSYSGGDFSGTIQSSKPVNNNYYYVTAWPAPVQSSGGGGGGGALPATAATTTTCELSNIIFTPLKKGDRSASVTQLQTTLKNLGYFNAPIDGYYWTTTIDAVAKFQKANNVRTVFFNKGLFGPLTVRAMNKLGKKTVCTTIPKVIASPKTLTICNASNIIFTPLKKGDRSASVTQLQTTLKNLGYFNAPIDGYYWTTTIDAVAKFQKANNVQTNISSLGLLGPATAQALTKKMKCVSPKVTIPKVKEIVLPSDVAQACYDNMIDLYLSGDKFANIAMNKLLVEAKYISVFASSKNVVEAARLMIFEDEKKERKLKLMTNCLKYYPY